jgi:hypothetical protein
MEERGQRRETQEAGFLSFWQQAAAVHETDSSHQQKTQSGGKYRIQGVTIMHAAQAERWSGGLGAHVGGNQRETGQYGQR